MQKRTPIVISVDVPRPAMVNGTVSTIDRQPAQQMRMVHIMGNKHM